MRCSRAATRSPSSTISRPGARELLGEAATLSSTTSAHPPFDVAGAELVFHLAAQADVGTSMQPAGLRRGRERARHGQHARGRPRRTARRSSSRRPAARSTASRAAGTRRRPAAAARRRTGSPKLAAEEYVAAWNRVHGTRPCRRSASRTSTARDSRRALEGGVVAIFLERLAERRDDRRSSATASRRATSSTSPTSSPRCSPRPAAAAASSTSAPAIETSRDRAARGSARGGRRATRSRVRGAARRRRAPQRARPVARAEPSSAGRPRRPCARGSRATLGGRAEGVAAPRGRIHAPPVDHRCPPPRRRAPGARPRSSPRASPRSSSLSCS